MHAPMSLSMSTECAQGYVNELLDLAHVSCSHVCMCEEGSDNTQVEVTLTRVLDTSEKV